MKFDKEYYIRRFPKLIEYGVLDLSLITDDVTIDQKVALLSMFGAYLIRGSTDAEWLKDIDTSNSYRINSYGYRDPEYDGPVDLIAAGCSQTFGQGVPEDYRWSSMLAKKLNMSVATVAIPGWSAMSAISSTMQFILTHGKPKVVALYLPDFFRFDYVNNTNILIDAGFDVKDHEVSALTVGHSGHIDKFPKLSKKPHYTEEVINPEMSHFMNGQVLFWFSEYCKEAGIQLVWGSWSMANQELVSYMQSLDLNMYENNSHLKSVHMPKYDLSGYVDCGYGHDEKESLEKLSEAGCHEEFKRTLSEENLKFYDYASDSEWHMSIHAHYHVANSFLGRLS